jgi:hypothetical protein
MEEYIGKMIRLTLKNGTIAEGKMTDYDLAINSGGKENEIGFYPTKIIVNNEGSFFIENPKGADFAFAVSEVESIEEINA